MIFVSGSEEKTRPAANRKVTRKHSQHVLWTRPVARITKKLQCFGEGQRYKHFA